MIEGAKRDPHFEGLSFADCPLADKTLLAFAKLENPERTIKTIEYLREKKNLSRYRSPEEQIALAAEAIDSGKLPSFGSEAERTAREAAAKRISELEKELERYRNTSASIGHNRPPEPIVVTDSAEPILSNREIATLLRTVSQIKEQLERNKPDVKAVLAVVQHIIEVQTRAAKRSPSRSDMFKDALVKSAGTQIPIAIFAALGALAWWFVTMGLI